MDNQQEQKATTRRFLTVDPNEERLLEAIEGRRLSPELVKNLKRLLKSKKWARQINIPSTHDGVAAVMVFASSLKEGGLEILCEMHVFFEDKKIVEEWMVMEENQPPSSLTAGVFRAAGIEKVRVEGTKVHVAVRGPLESGELKTIVKTFDFAEEPHDVRVVPHPFLVHA
jgi:hypothetical protein